jgi:hypothetical protein
MSVHALTYPQWLAMCAAAQASQAMTEMLRFAREGEGKTGPFDVEVVELLLDAVKKAIEIEHAQADDRRELVAVIDEFLEGWV